MKLNAIDYEHFTVVHKTTFKQKYQNADTGETIDCHTNRIEGAWKNCKDHFRIIYGTNTKSFEQHLAETVWRKHFHQEVYESFFKKVQVGKDQEKAQSEKDSHSKNRGGKKPN